MEAGKIYHVVGRTMNKFPFITLQTLIHFLFSSIFTQQHGHSFLLCSPQSLLRSGSNVALSNGRDERSCIGKESWKVKRECTSTVD